MKIDGGCHCGFIRFEAEADPAQTLICHCTDCRKLTGTAFRISLRVPGETFKRLSGEPSTYIKTADSGTRRAHSFCPRCGTPVWAVAADDAVPKYYSLRPGTLRQREQFAPKRQSWTRSRLRWLADIVSIPGSETQ